jgi:hypothetical protein
MAYAATGSWWSEQLEKALPGVATPAQVRQSKVAAKVVQLRGQGWDDEKIIAYLNQAGQRTALDLNHPCAGPRGKNLCTGDDLRLGFEMAAHTERGWKARTTKSTFLKIGGLLALGYVAYRLIGSRIK